LIGGRDRRCHSEQRETWKEDRDAVAVEEERHATEEQDEQADQEDDEGQRCWQDQWRPLDG
jgi:hypothetical protein